jgi:transposase IS4-like protein/DDE family transposase
MFKIQQLDEKEQFCKLLTFEAITRIVSEEAIQSVIETTQTREKRSRKLPARLVIWLCILMNIFSDIGLQAVLVRMVQGTRFLCCEGVQVVAQKSAISKARYRLGVKPLRQLFIEICQPLATPATPGAYAFELRLVAIDGTVEDAADTPKNEAYFGRQPGSSKNSGSAFPQVRCVYICECGTHAIFDAVFLPYLKGEVAGANRLLRAVQENMLVTLDRGLFSFAMFQGIRTRGSHVLGRVRSNIRPRCVESLPDGTYLAYISPSDYHRKKSGERLLVRVIEYTIDDPERPGHGEIHRLLTTLCDPEHYPATELICLYHERWEIEITIDEIDTHQRLLSTPLRSRKPEGVLQELYGLLIAHYIIRAIMHQAALHHDLDSDRLSFVNAVRLISNALAEFQIIACEAHSRWWLRLLDDIAFYHLPKRENRINPRVVKRKASKFKVKRPGHFQPPQPMPFIDGLVLIPNVSCA